MYTLMGIIALILVVGYIYHKYFVKGKWQEADMGRAIDMEKDIDILKREVADLKDILKQILEGVGDDKKEAKKTDTKRSKTSGGKRASRPEHSEQQS